MTVSISNNSITKSGDMISKGIDILFLEKIKQKLQTGNTRSIYLNCHPGRLATRLDITSLDHVMEELSKNFLDDLLSSTSFSFVFRIDIDSAADDEQRTRLGIVSKRLTSIMYENNDNYLEHGIKTLGFGYPVIAYECESDPGKIINAPVFIWRLELKKNANVWTISRSDDNAIFMNETLLNFLEQDMQSPGLTRLPEDTLADSLLDQNEVIMHSNDLVKEIKENAQLMEIIEGCIPIHHKDKLKNIINEKGSPYLYNAGVLGLFRTPKESIIKDVKELIKQYESFQFDRLKTEHYQTIPFSAVDTDPSQRKVLNELAANNKIVIHGPPGTGKSQSLTAIIVNALVNGRRCLVVCEKRTALEVIKNNLAKLGLDELCGLVEDVNRDRKPVIDSVRDREQTRMMDMSHDLKSTIQRLQSDINSVNRGHRFYSKFFVDRLNWTSLVGSYMSYDKKELIVKLYSELKELTYDFMPDNTENDFKTLTSNTALSHKYYKEIENLEKFSGMEDVYLKRFSGAAELKMDILERINFWVHSIKDQVSAGQDILKAYDEHLNKYYTDYHDKITSLCEQLLKIIDDNKDINGSFIKPTLFDRIKLSVLKVFSSKLKKFRTDRDEYYEFYNKLADVLKCNYFNSGLTSIERDNFEGSVESIDKLTAAADAWINNISDFINEGKTNLSADNYDKYSGYDRDILTKYKINCDNLLNEPVTSKIFKSTPVQSAHSINEYLKQLSDTEQMLNDISSKIDDLSDYYNWRIHYNSVDDNSRNAIDTLIRNHSDDWQSDIGMWFIFNILIKNEAAVTLCDDVNLNHIDEAFEKIKVFQKNEIFKQWTDRQLIANAKFKEKYKFAMSILYNKSRNSSFAKRNPLRTIIKYDFELFTSYFPVMLVNPSVCSSLFEMKEGLFDVVIFDEASQLRIEDVYCSKLRGKYKIVSGDENQMPPSNYFASVPIHIDSPEAEDNDDDETAGLTETLADVDSLLDYATAKGYKETTLDIHYRSKHPALINFSNAAFYGSRLTPMPEKNSYKPIRYYNLSSLYDQDLGINLTEAKKVLELVEHLVSNEHNRSIGIATLNIFQRNLILDLINQKCIDDTQFAFKFNRMANIPNEPFFVKNLENIQGDERDIIIISTTFGLRENGVFLQNFGPINQEKGFRLLNVIISRAKHELHVITSIPETYIMNYKQHLRSGNNSGRGIFYAYLAYAKAVSEDDTESIESILYLLAANASNVIRQTDSRITESVFEHEVIGLLSKHISAGRLETQYKLGGFRVDIMIKDRDAIKPVIAIECDGANYHSSSETYAWDIFRQKQLEQHGLKFIRIWSKNWWHNTDRELTKLLKFVEENG